MWYSIVGFLAFVFVAIPILPWPGMRYRAIGLLHRVLHLGALGAVLAAGVFFFAPNSAPEAVVVSLEPVSNRLAQILPMGHPGLEWLPMAAMFVAVSLPVLALVDFAQRLSFQTALVRRLLGDIRESARSLERSISEETESQPASKPARKGEVKSVIETIDSITGVKNNATKSRRPLIELMS